MKSPLASVAVSFFMCVAGAQTADFPLTLAASAQVSKGATTITTILTIRVERLMNETFRTRVVDALKFGGYPKFLPALRALPPIGKVQFDGREVELRYAHEEPRGKGSRLVLVADQPLFFLGDRQKPRAGYELTMVELILDAQGEGTGTMTGAARVKPAPDGGIVVDEFETAPVQLTVRKALVK